MMREAAGKESRTMLPALIGQPPISVSFATSRAIVTGENARRNSLIAIGISAG